MSSISIAQPDVTLLLDMEGVIRNATLSGSISAEAVDSWLGKPWRDTVTDLGGEKVRRMLDDAKAGGVSAFRQVTQRFPSGLELPMEYTTLMLGGRIGLIAIGKSLHAIADLQSRLIAAQQAMERDHWKVREIETRYRLLFEASNEAVVLVRSPSLKIVEANPAALQALGLAQKGGRDINGRAFLQAIAPQDRDALQAMLARVRDHGKAPALLVHLGDTRTPWMVRAAPTASDHGPLFLLQLAPVGGSPPAPARPLDHNLISVEEMLDRVPDGFAVLDEDGVVRRANRAFLDLIEVSSPESAIGESAARWLWRPGADLSVLLANFRRHKVVRLFSTTIHGERGTEVDVEISLAATSEFAPRHLGMVVRDVSRRLQPPPDERRLVTALAPAGDQPGRVPLRKAVDDAVAIVERHHITAAIEAAMGNRTVAAEILGLSRQSLYAKLKRYGLEQRSSVDADSDG